MGLRAVTAPAVTPSLATTTPVTDLVPIGTMTRAPTAGTSMPAGTVYVRRSSAGTGTATRTSKFLILDQFSHELHVFPDLTLRRRVSQQVSGMERRDQF